MNLDQGVTLVNWNGKVPS